MLPEGTFSLSKERRLSLLGRSLRPSYLALAVLALLCGLAGLSGTSPADARVFFVSIIDRNSLGFSDGDFDLADTQVFPLTLSDGVPGNVGFVIDTFFAPVGATVWLGIAVEEGNGDVSVDANDYGTFTNALCNDNNGDGLDFRDPDDRCVNTTGLGTDQVVIADTGNVLEHQPLAALPRMGLGVAYRCQANPGIARVTIGQTGQIFQFFIVCHGPLVATQISATKTELEIWPAPPVPQIVLGSLLQGPSSAHSLVRLQLVDASGGPVAGYEVDWTVDRCGVETGDINAVEEALDIIGGVVHISDTQGPDAATPQADNVRNLVYDFDGDGRLEALSFAIIHCDPPHSPTNTPGPITIRAHISREGEPSRDVVFVINLIGPPARIFLQATPLRVQCGEKISMTAAVVDVLGQPVSDNTPIEFVVNLGGTVAAQARFLAPVAPISSGIGFTRGGVAQFFLLTSTVNIGNYDVIATSEGVFSTPPVSNTVSVSCFVPASPTATSAAAAPTVVSGAAPATGAIRPPNTGDGGLLPSRP